jgi:hypothetical protein
MLILIQDSARLHALMLYTTGIHLLNSVFWPAQLDTSLIQLPRTAKLTAQVESMTTYPREHVLMFVPDHTTVMLITPALLNAQSPILPMI